MKEKIEKPLAFFMLVIWAVGSCTAFGYMVYLEEPVVAFMIVVLALMAWPVAKNCWYVLNPKE